MRIVSLGVAFLLACSGLGQADAAAPASDLAVWYEFVDLLRAQPFPTGRVRPYREGLREPVLGFLKTMREQADWGEWISEPEAFRVDERIHYVLPLTFTGQRTTYCFSFILEDGE